MQLLWKNKQGGLERFHYRNCERPGWGRVTFDSYSKNTAKSDFPSVSRFPRFAISPIVFLPATSPARQIKLTAAFGASSEANNCALNCGDSFRRTTTPSCPFVLAEAHSIPIIGLQLRSRGIIKAILSAVVSGPRLSWIVDSLTKCKMTGENVR